MKKEICLPDQNEKRQKQNKNKRSRSCENKAAGVGLDFFLERAFWQISNLKNFFFFLPFYQKDESKARYLCGFVFHTGGVGSVRVPGPLAGEVRPRDGVQRGRAADGAGSPNLQLRPFCCRRQNRKTNTRVRNKTAVSTCTQTNAGVDSRGAKLPKQPEGICCIQCPNNTWVQRERAELRVAINLLSMCTQGSRNDILSGTASQIVNTLRAAKK